MIYRGFRYILTLFRRDTELLISKIPEEFPFYTIERLGGDSRPFDCPKIGFVGIRNVRRQVHQDKKVHPAQFPDALLFVMTICYETGGTPFHTLILSFYEFLKILWTGLCNPYPPLLS